MQTTSAIPALGRLHDRVRCPQRRNKDTGDVGPSLLYGLCDRIKDREVQGDLAAFAGSDASQDLGAGGQHALGMVESFSPCYALYDDTRTFIEKNAHVVPLCPCAQKQCAIHFCRFWPRSRQRFFGRRRAYPGPRSARRRPAARGPRPLQSRRAGRRSAGRSVARSAP